MVHRKTMITMGSPDFVWINTNEIISSWYLLGAVCVAAPTSVRLQLSTISAIHGDETTGETVIASEAACHRHPPRNQAFIWDHHSAPICHLGSPFSTHTSMASHCERSVLSSGRRGQVCGTCSAMPTRASREKTCTATLGSVIIITRTAHYESFTVSGAGYNDNAAIKKTWSATVGSGERTSPSAACATCGREGRARREARGEDRRAFAAAF
jgi:hypothetical protein